MKVLMLEAGANRFQGLDDPDPANVRLAALERRAQAATSAASSTRDPLAEPRTFRTAPSDGDRSYVGDVNGAAQDRGRRRRPRRPEDAALPARRTSSSGRCSATSRARASPTGRSPTTSSSRSTCTPRTPWACRGSPGPTPSSRRAAAPLPDAAGRRRCTSASSPRAGATSLGYTAFPYPARGQLAALQTAAPPASTAASARGYGCPINAKGSPGGDHAAARRCSRATASSWPETRAVKLLAQRRGQRDDGRRRPSATTASALHVHRRPLHPRREPHRGRAAAPPLGPRGAGARQLERPRRAQPHVPPRRPQLVGIFEERVHGHRGQRSPHSDHRLPRRAQRHQPPARRHRRDRRPGGPARRGARASTPAASATTARAQDADAPEPVPRPHHSASPCTARTRRSCTNVVDLDPAVRDLDGLPVARVTYTNHAFELSARTFYLAEAARHPRRGRGRAAASSPPSTQCRRSRHIMGTLRFGADPKQSVCDPTGRFHDVGNLYAADGVALSDLVGLQPEPHHHGARRLRSRRDGVSRLAGASAALGFSPAGPPEPAWRSRGRLRWRRSASWRGFAPATACG